MSRLIVAMKELVPDCNTSTHLLRRVLELEERVTVTTGDD